MPKPKVIIFGYDELLLSSLDVISESDVDISSVVFPSNRKDPRINKIREMVESRGFNTLTQPPRKQIAQFIKQINLQNPDLIFVWSYTMILPPEIIKIPKLGAVNLHMGLLPEYRGVNGVRWALINGEKETGVTIHFMDNGIDTGDILSRASFPIEEQDDILSLMIKSRSAGQQLLKQTWTEIASGNTSATPQDESKASYYSAKMSDIEAIDWSKTSEEIVNLIRASAIPFPGVNTVWQDRELTVRKGKVLETESQNTKSGTIVNLSDSGVEVASRNGSVLLTKIEIDGKEVSVPDLKNLGLERGIKIYTP